MKKVIMLLLALCFSICVEAQYSTIVESIKVDTSSIYSDTLHARNGTIEYLDENLYFGDLVFGDRYTRYYRSISDINPYMSTRPYKENLMIATMFSWASLDRYKMDEVSPLYIDLVFYKGWLNELVIWCNYVYIFETMKYLKSMYGNNTSEDDGGLVWRGEKAVLRYACDEESSFIIFASLLDYSKLDEESDKKRERKNRKALEE